MPLSLALFSDMVGISAMDQRKNLAMGLVLFPIPGLGIFQLDGAEIFDVLEYQAKEDTRPIFQFFDTNTSIISAVWAIISANDFGN